MPSDPTPTEAEMREAGQWASLQVAVDLEEKCMMRDAYAAALAKCRGMVEADRERCAKKLKQWADDAYVNYIRKCDSDLCRGLDFKLSHGEFTKQNLKAHCEASEHFGKHKGFMEAAAAIRGGEE